ncbi:MAG: hypothetical protein R3F61_36005 [Myxococcota bacterium]
MISTFILSMALAADHPPGGVPAASADFTFDIQVQADLLIDCSVNGAGVSPAAFSSATQADVENVAGVSFGTLGPMGNLFGWFNSGTALWYVGGEANLTCANSPGLATIAVDASATGTGGADGFFNLNHVNLDVTAPTNLLPAGGGPSPVITPTAVPFTQPISLGAAIDAGDNPTSSATITFTFAPA